MEQKDAKLLLSDDQMKDVSGGLSADDSEMLHANPDGKYQLCCNACGFVQGESDNAPYLISVAVTYPACEKCGAKSWSVKTQGRTVFKTANL